MRNAYALNAFFEALSAWERHREEYLAALENARQPKPPSEVLENYRNVWVEGYLEARTDYAESKQVVTTGSA
jgi:hypothetical protein